MVDKNKITKRHDKLTFDAPTGKVTVKVTRHCMWCKGDTLIELEEQKLLTWRRGEVIQAVWPLVPLEEREVLITGTHPTCWAEMFKDEGDDT